MPEIDSDMKTRQGRYVEFFYDDPRGFVKWPEYTGEGPFIVEFPTGTNEVDCPKDAVACRFFQRTEAEINGERLVGKSKPIRHYGVYNSFYDGGEDFKRTLTVNGRTRGILVLPETGECALQKTGKVSWPVPDPG